MWNITSSELELAREELKGRRAAVEARYAKDLQGLDADLAEIETLERAAAAFALKHKTEAEQGTATTEAEAESKTASEMPAVAAHATDRAGRPAEASRWRLSLGDRSSTTQV
jgi:citrate synthase